MIDFGFLFVFDRSKKKMCYWCEIVVCDWVFNSRNKINTALQELINFRSLSIWLSEKHLPLLTSVMNCLLCFHSIFNIDMYKTESLMLSNKNVRCASHILTLDDPPTMNFHDGTKIWDLLRGSFLQWNPAIYARHRHIVDTSLHFNDKQTWY